MKEVITIEHFGGIKKASISLNSINIFIGKQASGKSVTAKLLYFFKKIFGNIIDTTMEGKTKRDFDSQLLIKFEEYFPSECGTDNAFFIKYELGDDNITLEKEIRKNVKISYSPRIIQLFAYSKRITKKQIASEEDDVLFDISYQALEKYHEHVSEMFGKRAATQLFIPAGRSFFANLQSSIFSFLSKNKEIDPFLVEFGSFYVRMKDIAVRRPRFHNESKDDKFIDKLIGEILCGKYQREKEKDYILHEDDRKINVSFSSSGQQETLPLTTILKAITKIRFMGKGATVYIEEPEAHLFPSAQKKMVELIASVYNISNNELQFIITTHSPYILTSFNNLLQAGLLREQGINTTKLFKIVPECEIIQPSEIGAFAMKNGVVENLINKSEKLITSSVIDQVSEDIAIQFDDLLDL
jgi:predicted ATP-dependent endonuclease of OLD family